MVLSSQGGPYNVHPRAGMVGEHKWYNEGEVRKQTRVPAVSGLINGNDQLRTLGQSALSTSAGQRSSPWRQAVECAPTPLHHAYRTLSSDKWETKHRSNTNPTYGCHWSGITWPFDKSERPAPAQASTQLKPWQPAM